MVYFELRCRLRNRCNVTIVKALVILIEIALIEIKGANVSVIIATVTGAVRHSPLPVPTVVAVIEATVCRFQRSRNTYLFEGLVLEMKL